MLAEEQYYQDRRKARGLDPINHNLKAATAATEDAAQEDAAGDNAAPPTPPARNRQQEPA